MADRRPPRNWAPLRSVAAGFVVLIGAVGVILYWIGRPAGWSPVAWAPSSSVEGFSIDRSSLGPRGEWLMWFDSSLGAVCAKDLRSDEAVAAFHPGEFFVVSPVAVIDGNLLVLRSQRSSGIIANLRHAFAKILKRESSDGVYSEDLPTPVNRTTYLESIDLESGQRVARNASLSNSGALEGPSDFELGKVAVSPAGDRFAYWAAQEAPGSTPLEATVTEVLRVYDAGGSLKPVIDRRISSPGTFFIRSSLLAGVGRPFWVSKNTCLFLSFLDAGSLIPVDVPQAAFDATYPIVEVYRKILDENSDLLYGPEGIETLRGGDDTDSTLLFWGRRQDSIHFFLFDSQLTFRRETVAATAGYDFTMAVWLERSERLLVDDNGGNRLVAFSPYGESEISFPLPPDWSDGFRILGEDSETALVGTDRRMFLKSSEGQRDWEAIPLH